jgi:dephospho-CoA kinase
MIHVGLTGNIGSGKTTVSRLFAMHGVPVYYADERGKNFLSTPQTVQKIVDSFGSEYIGADGTADRKKLASLVFGDKEKLETLNQIIHPQVKKDFLNWVLRQSHHPYAIMESAILFESGQHVDFHKVVMVTAPEHLRINRVCSRDGVPSEDVKKRIQHQMDEEKKTPLVDFVIINDGQHLLMPQVVSVHEQILALCK